MLIFISNWISSLGQAQRFQFYMKIRHTTGIYLCIFSSQNYGLVRFYLIITFVVPSFEYFIWNVFIKIIPFYRKFAWCHTRNRFATHISLVLSTPVSVLKSSGRNFVFQLFLFHTAVMFILVSDKLLIKLHTNHYK